MSQDGGGDGRWVITQKENGETNKCAGWECEDSEAVHVKNDGY